MSAFTKKICVFLDTWGEKRSKHLKLCVRVPYTVKWSNKIGLDVGSWDEVGLMDMVNVSTYFICNPRIDVVGYKAMVKKVPLQ